MDAIKTGVERHEQLEKIFNGPSFVNTEVFEAIKPGVSDTPAFRRAMANYQTALGDLNRILMEQDPKLKTVFEKSLRNDGVYEYTSTGTCDGSQTFAFRRLPAIVANPSSWESIESVPEGVKYGHA